jgi:hypothetical protein
MAENDLAKTGYRKAIALLHSCATDDGFVATPAGSDNYRRVWGRDGAILSLAALLSGDEELIETARRTLETLARYQGPHGEIPSNVDPASDRVSYGGTAGRVDADLWFLVACGEFWARTGDRAFLERLLPNIHKAYFLLGAWQFNNRGLIYVPLTGDWADEYLQHGYVLYDQLLYLQAQRAVSRFNAETQCSHDHVLEDRISRLCHLIRDNYWFGPEEPEGDAYHEVLYRKGIEAARKHCSDCHWMPSFSPSGYGYRFDAFANVLVSLLDVADDRQRAKVDSYIESELLKEELPLLPAFHPVIKPVDEDWEELRVMFSYSFKNEPYEFHNGGLWPMLSGFYAADLAQRGRREQATRILDAVHRANAMEMEGEPWSFPEYLHGRELTPGGSRLQGWSAAGAVLAHQALAGKRIFRIGHDDR